MHALKHITQLLIIIYRLKANLREWVLLTLNYLINRYGVAKFILLHTSHIY